MRLDEIIEKARTGESELTDEEVLNMLEMDTHSEDFYHLICASNEYSRKTFHNRGYIFVQIGLNAEPCSGNCLFCSMGASHYSMNERWRKRPEDVAEEIGRIRQNEIDDIFLMTTADYPFELYLDVVSKVKPMLDSKLRLVANVGDFDYDMAMKMKAAGITGVYHVNRLREGIDTSIEVEERIRTLDVVKRAGLEMYYCIEPIGAEHSYEEILTEIRRAESLEPEVMAVMRRVNYPDSPLVDRKMITAIELVKIAAVTNLVVRPSRAMNLHESEQMSLLAGVNQLYAEIGANPRDVNAKTETSRGLSVYQTRKMLSDANFDLQ